MSSIKIINGALQELDNGQIILRGVLEPVTLHLLKTAPYQREVLPISAINELVKALKTSTVPDVELGMRGQKFMERDEVFYLQDDVYIVDGLQRVTAALTWMQHEPGAKPQIGAAIHFSTTEATELERFRILNSERSKLSPNILIRNLRGTNDAVNMLHNLCHDKSFTLFDRVCWEQRMKRNDLLTALTLCKMTGRVHQAFSPGRTGHWTDLTTGLLATMKKVGRNTLRENMKTYFDVIDQCWGIRRIAFNQGVPQIRNTFLTCLADLFAAHYDFWKGKEENQLYVSIDQVRKLSLFPVNDPQVANLSSAGGKAREMLYMMMVNHVNSGRRTGRLKPRALEHVPEVSLSDTFENHETTQ